MDPVNFSTVLQQFGFSKPEAEIYISSLSLGPQPASIIAKNAGLKRGHAYNVLSQLKDRGIMQEFIRGGVRHFVGSPPATLLSLLTSQEQTIALQKQRLLQMMPALEKIRNPLILQPKVRFFQGVEGMKEVYNDTIRIPKKIIYALCDFEHLFPASQSSELHNWLWEYTNRRAAKGVWLYGIINKSPESDIAYKWRRKQKRKMKMLRNVYLPVEYIVYGDKVAFISTKEDMVGVIIENKPIAETLRNFHKAMWGVLPDYR
jgi:sugar-specific transcriptional regulator TrmB